MSLASAAPTEQALREELAAAYRLMALFNMTDLVYASIRTVAR